MALETATLQNSPQHRSIALLKCNKCGAISRVLENRAEQKCEHCGSKEFREVKK